MLPESWINKVFSTFEGRYGAMFHDRWKGCDLASVKSTWREELAGFSDQPERIGQALKSLADQQFPPTLPEFITACRRAPGKDQPALTHKPTAEELEHGKEMAHKAAAVVKPKEFDGLLWAKRPKSQKAMDMIADAKKNARHFPALAVIFDQHIQDGICNDAGKLLYRWGDLEWVKA